MEAKSPHILRMKEGMSTLPSDVSVSDDALTAEVGMLFENGEHRVIQNPVPVTTELSIDVLYIHDFANYTHLIGKTQGGELKFVAAPFSTSETPTYVDFTPTGVTLGTILDVSSVGNTLLVLTDEGMTYFLWKPSEGTNGNYVYLGNTLPEIEAEYSLTMAPDFLTEERANITGFVENSTSEHPDTTYVLTEYKEAFKNAIVGHVAAVQNEYKKKGWFLYPFWVRLAWQMYDGENTMLTAPVLVLASVRNNQFISGCKYNENDLIRQMVYYPYAMRLSLKVKNTDLAEWSDIINGLDVYLSDMVCPFEIDGKWRLEYDDYAALSQQGIDVWSSVYSTSVGAASIYGETKANGERYRLYAKLQADLTQQEFDDLNFTGEFTHIAVPEETLGDAEIMKRLIDNAQFYRAAEIPLKDIDTSWHYMDEMMRKNVLLNLTSQHQLAHDDYFNHCKMSAKSMFVYNGRLHLGGVERGFFAGYDHFLVSTGASKTCSEIYVYIDTDEGEKMICKQIPSPYLSELMGYYFYYPDPRAKKVTFVMSDYSHVTRTLTTHPWLHGAYFFDALPTSHAHLFDETTPGPATITPATDQGYEALLPSNADNDGTEALHNQLVVSEVSNPFLFTVDGWEDIGSGQILGMASNVEAVSEGQFGQYPLYVFTTEGIWALSVNSTGLYDTIRPLSREVCNNAKSITQTDKAIYFTTDKGLMRLSGSQVTCVSPQMMGANFNVDVLKREDDIDSLVSVEDDVLTYHTSAASVDDSTIDSGGGITVVVGESLILGSDQEIPILSDITPFERFIRPSNDVTPLMCYDYRNSRLWLFRSDSDWVYVHSMITGAFALYNLRSRLKSSHIFYPDTWLQDADGRMLSMGKIPFIDDDEESYDAILLTRPISFGSPFAYKQVQQLDHLITKDSNCIVLRLFGSNNTREWHEEKVLRGRPYRYFRFLINLNGLSAADAYSSMMVMTETRRTGRLHPEDWHSIETEQSRPNV